MTDLLYDNRKRESCRDASATPGLGDNPSPAALIEYGVVCSGSTACGIGMLEVELAIGTGPRIRAVEAPAAF